MRDHYKHKLNHLWTAILKAHFNNVLLNNDNNFFVLIGPRQSSCSTGIILLDTGMVKDSSTTTRMKSICYDNFLRKKAWENYSQENRRTKYYVRRFSFNKLLTQKSVGQMSE